MTEKPQTRQQIAQELATERARYNMDRFRWMQREADLLRVLFQLSEALEYKKHH